MTTLDQIAEHLTARGLRFRQVGDERIDIGFNGDNTIYEAVITVRGPHVSVVASNVAVVPAGRLNEWSGERTQADVIDYVCRFVVGAEDYLNGWLARERSG